MSVIKVVKEAREVYYMSTYQGELSVDETKYTYRYSEDSNGATLYILENGNWNEYDSNNEDHLQILNACLLLSPEEFGYIGEVLDLDDDFA